MGAMEKHREKGEKGEKGEKNADQVSLIGTVKKSR